MPCQTHNPRGTWKLRLIASRIDSDGGMSDPPGKRFERTRKTRETNKGNSLLEGSPSFLFSFSSVQRISLVERERVKDEDIEIRAHATPLAG